MSNNPETVGIERPSDPLMEKQKRDVTSMRNTLMACNTSDPNSVKAAMNNILVMRIYHQISRIIKYTEQMDKIEEKLYSSIDATLDTLPDLDPRTWLTLLNLQERLQRIMIDSHKLLEPYLSMENLTYIEISPDSASDSFAKSLLDQDSRERLRSGAQAILAALDAGEVPPTSSDDTDESGGENA